MQWYLISSLNDTEISNNTKCNILYVDNFISGDPDMIRAGVHFLIGIKVNPQISGVSAPVLWEADSRRELEEQNILRKCQWMIKRRRRWDRKGKSSNTCLDNTWEKTRSKRKIGWRKLYISGQLLESVGQATAMISHSRCPHVAEIN